MKLIILSDLHGNLEAFQAALNLIKNWPDAQILCLGDIVGYGANPRECLAEVRKIVHISLAGNHDYAVAGLTNIKYFNKHAKEAVLWTIDHLKQQEIDYLKSLSIQKRIHNKFFLVHSTPINPELWNYILTEENAIPYFSGFKDQICFVGHSHRPMVLEKTPNDTYNRLDYNKPFQIKTGHKYIINVGSIGQPRDGDWRACFLIYDDQSQIIEFKRIEYDLLTVQDKIRQAGLPCFLADRLQFGI